MKMNNNQGYKMDAQDVLPPLITTTPSLGAFTPP